MSDELEERLGAEPCGSESAGWTRGSKCRIDLVGEVADGSAVEGGQVGIGDEVEAIEFGFDLVERVDCSA